MGNEKGRSTSSNPVNRHERLHESRESLSICALEKNEILRIPAESSMKEESTIIIMFTKSLRNTFTKLKSNAKEAANKAVSAVKHKGQLSDIPDEMLW